jgi:hypothetical protein
MLSAMALLACPFCRELFQEGERDRCPVCGVALVAWGKLPPSHETVDEDGSPLEPEREILPPTYLGRGRGVLAGLAFAGLIAFFLPWVELTMPDVVAFSGFSLAQRLGGRGGRASHGSFSCPRC